MPVPNTMLIALQPIQKAEEKMTSVTIQVIGLIQGEWTDILLIHNECF